MLAVIFIHFFKEGDNVAKAKYTKGKDGYFSTKAWDGTYNKDGTKHLKNLRSKKSSRDLENMVKVFETEVEARRKVKKVDITFFDYACKWVAVYKAQRSQNTRSMYQNIVNRYFSVIAGTRLQDIDRIHIQILLNAADNKKRTQQQILLTFKQVLKSAVADHIFPANVMEDIFNNTESVNYRPAEKRPLTQSEREAVFKADFQKQDRIFVYLIYGCGLRRGEALSLTIFDFNLKSQEVSINKSHEFVKDKPQQKAPKSKNGYRTVPIPDSIFSAVDFYIADLKQKGRTYLFTMRDGQPVTKSSYDKMWKRIVARMQDTTNERITGLTAHVFRHNYCTNLCYQIPKISIKKIAQLLGDTEAVVLKVYNHMILEKEDAASAVNDAMNF